MNGSGTWRNSLLTKHIAQLSPLASSVELRSHRDPGWAPQALTVCRRVPFWESHDVAPAPAISVVSCADLSPSENPLAPEGDGSGSKCCC